MGSRDAETKNYFCYINNFDTLKPVTSMKNYFLILAFFTIASCGNNSQEGNSTSTPAITDTPANGTVIIDTAGLPSMNADTTGMGTAR
jgi:hypothetical protein